MTQDKTILIKNIYYMLSYAFKVLKQKNYEKIQTENFDHIENLFAAIIDNALSQLLKQGLYREYANKQESIKTLRGKIELGETIKIRTKKENGLVCKFDELSLDNSLNQIIKTTVSILRKNNEVDSKIKNSLKKKMLYFASVSEIYDVNTIHWNMLTFHANNKIYEMIINVCYFVITGLIQTTDVGSRKVMAFSEEHMERLYEKFILEYYRYEHPDVNAHPSQIEWDIDSNDSSIIKFLPKMQTDVTLTTIDKTLIIDAKYYGQIMARQERFDSKSYHSNNMYQIFTYVKNADHQLKGNVSGILMYAQTNEIDVPVGEITIGGNRFGIKVLDLNTEFSKIREQLDNLAKEFL